MSDYDRYLESETWKAKRLEALSRAQWRCQVCGAHSSRSTLEVHHRDYKRLGKAGEMADLVVLCGDCHGLFHEKLPKEPT